jgi:hypothetical protein
MAVAFDAASQAASVLVGAGPQTWTHTPVGTPRGVAVWTYTLANDVEVADTVTYGGVSLTKVVGGSAVDSAGELMRATLWFVGASIPTGAQTVSVARLDDSNATFGSCITVTALTDTNAYATGVVLLQGDQTVAEVNVTDASPGTNSLRVAGGVFGNNVAPTAGASSTGATTFDDGAITVVSVYETTAGQGSRAIGFTAGVSDDCAAVHIALRESGGSATAVPVFLHHLQQQGST